MVTNLKQNKDKSKKGGWINPISLGVFFLMISIILSSILGRTALVEKMAKRSYFSSRDFQDTIVELTLYLKQTKLDVAEDENKDNIKLNPTFENIRNLTYVMTRDTKIVTNDTLNSIAALRKNSETYYHIKFTGKMNPFVMSNLPMDKTIRYDINDPSESYISGELRFIMSCGLVGEANENKDLLDYEGLEVYYFMGNHPLVEDDFIYTNIKNQEDVERIKLAIYVHLIMLGLWAVIVFISAIQRKFQSGIWLFFRKIPIDIKGLVALIGVIVAFKTYYWLLWQNSLLYACLHSNLLTQIRIGTTLGMCLVSWYIVDLVAICRKEYQVKSILSQYLRKKGYHLENVLSKEFKRKALSTLYSKVGIDIRKPYQFKVVLYNLVHLAVLWYFGIWSGHFAYYDEQSRFIIGLISIAVIIELFILYKFQQLTNIIGTIKNNKPHVQMTKKVLYMLMRLTIYGGVLYSILYSNIVDAIIDSLNLDYTRTNLSIIHVIILTILGLVVMFWSLKVVEDYRKLYLYVADIAKGKEELTPPTSFLGPITDELSKIDREYKEAVQQELVSQRMKTELISNVSHDLKTPLTSIINYVDLLKKEDLTEEAKEYVRILDQKSVRLKVLIEDLFEASKTASGNLELNKEKLDLVSLLKQTLSELEEKIEASNLQFRVTMPEEKVYCTLDGQRTYRIFENLLNNILKYAAPYSRVYINGEQKNGWASIIFRNVSASEMNFTGNEIMERFKRGDTSRNTEGSGLGLAIAKNLTELQGGTLDIVIDGDLFKVIVTFPIEENKEDDSK